MSGQLFNPDEQPARLTYRERRERKAERLREWADKREAKASSAHETSSDAVAGIPFGQPIIRGHYSQRRHERAIERSQRAMSAAVEHSSKAASFRSRAANIEAAADHAIYSDDPDAIERLRDKIAGLESQRETIKRGTPNIAKAHRDELKALTAYGRDRALPYPSYVLTNLGGNISPSRKRLVQLERAS